MADTGEFTDVEGLIDPAVWPYRAGKLGLSWIQDVRAVAVRVAGGVREVAGEMRTSWSGLTDAGVYQAEESRALYGAMAPVFRDAESSAEACDTAVTAFDDYSEELGSLESRLRDAESEATMFRNAVACGVVVPVEDLPFVRVQGLGATSSFGTTTPGVALGASSETLAWREHRPSLERHQDLIARIAGITAQIRDAEATLVKRLKTVDDVESGARPMALPEIDRLGPAADGFMNPPKWFGTASDDEIADWWKGLAPWEREAAADAVDAMDLDPAEIAEQVEAALRDVADRPDGHEDVETADAMIMLFGGDERVMDPVMQALGASGLVAGLAGIARETGHGEGTPATRRRKLEMFEELRESLADVSARWTMDEAREFARDDIDDIGAYLRPELGYLFGDQYGDLMGENLTVAMADQMDQLERGDLEGPAVYYEPPMSPFREVLIGAGQDEEATRRINDPTARVLGTLGQYPAAALDWLTDESWDEYFTDKLAGEARLDYYYQFRDSASSGDGFEGVAALWRGALQAPGGPNDPAAYGESAPAYDPETWKKVATVTTGAMRGLASNGDFIPENVSTNGSVELAGATVLALPHLVDATVIEYNARLAGSNAFVVEDRLLPGMSGLYDLPNVSRAALAEMVAAATARSEGAAVLADGARTQRDAFLALAGLGVSTDRMFERATLMQGMIDGAEHGGEAGLAAHRDAQAQRAIDAVSSTIGSLVPGVAGKLVDGVADTITDALRKEALDALEKKVIAAAVGQGGNKAVEWGTEQAEGAWVGNLAAAEADAEAETAARREALANLIDDFARDHDLYAQVIDGWEAMTAEERTAAIKEYGNLLLGSYDLAYNNQYDGASTGRQDDTED